MQIMLESFMHTKRFYMQRLFVRRTSIWCICAFSTIATPGYLTTAAEMQSLICNHLQHPNQRSRSLRQINPTTNFSRYSLHHIRDILIFQQIRPIDIYR
jgi:hypothetical protein